MVDEIKHKRLQKRLERRDKRIMGLERKIKLLESALAVRTLDLASLTKNIRREVTDALCNVRMVPVSSGLKGSKILDIRYSSSGDWREPISKGMKGIEEYTAAKFKTKEDFEAQLNEYFAYWNQPDPSDATEAALEQGLRAMGIDPDDWKLLVELGLLVKGWAMELRYNESMKVTAPEAKALQQLSQLEYSDRVCLEAKAVGQFARLMHTLLTSHANSKDYRDAKQELIQRGRNAKAVLHPAQDW